MIDKLYGKFYTTCDMCGEELDPTDTFDEAKRQIASEGWKTIKEDFDYLNLCPDCVKEV